VWQGEHGAPNQGGLITAVVGQQLSRCVALID
jgi:hypothetical protein